MADFMRACIGSKRSGRTVVLRSEFVIGLKPNLDVERRARLARYCTGHASWPTMERVRKGADTFMFTILRDPRRRLWSLYNYLSGGNFPAKMIPHGMHDLYADMLSMTARDFFTCADPRLRTQIDNVMVRQLGGGMEHLPPTAYQGSALTQAAKRNLALLDYVGFTESFAADFPLIIAAIDLPPARAVPHAKISQPHLRDTAARERAFERFCDEVGSDLEALVTWDQELYNFAVNEFGTGAVPAEFTA